MIKSFQALQDEICACRKCPRLVDWREQVAVEKVKRFEDWSYWGKAVPSFGDEDAELLIVGLAPAAHGANRTGRMFTGDRSGDWLYRALYKAAFASQAESTSKEDGLELINCCISAVAHCAPPLNKLTAEERSNCRPYLEQELALMEKLKVIVCLGKTSFDATLDAYQAVFPPKEKLKRPAFGHGVEVSLWTGVTLIGSYHCSQQNTFTKRLSEPMFDEIFKQVRSFLM